MLLDKKNMKEPLEENKIALGIALGAALGSTMQKEDSSSAEKWKISITKKRNYYKGKKWN